MKGKQQPMSLERACLLLSCNSCYFIQEICHATNLKLSGQLRSHEKKALAVCCTFQNIYLYAFLRIYSKKNISYILFSGSTVRKSWIQGRGIKTLREVCVLQIIMVFFAFLIEIFITCIFFRDIIVLLDKLHNTVMMLFGA